MATGNSVPTSPIHIPKAVSNYTASTIDSEIRSSVNSRLLADGHITKIHDALLHALHASPTNWPTLIQNHALDLLRNGECTTFHEVFERVLEDIHTDTVVKRSSECRKSNMSSGSNHHSSEQKNTTSNDNKNTTKMETNVSGSAESRQNLALPLNVVEEGFRITRECLETMCEIDD